MEDRMLRLAGAGVMLMGFGAASLVARNRSVASRTLETSSRRAAAAPRLLESRAASLAHPRLPARTNASVRQARVFVRLGRIDPLLRASGLDSLSVYSELAMQLREHQLLEERPDESTPAFDVVLSLNRSVGGEIRYGVVDVEVGRNLMERGKSQRLIWQRTESVRGPTTLPRMVEGLRAMLGEIVATYSRG